MIGVNDLLVVTSPVKRVGDTDIFNIHIEDTRDLTKYKFVNIVYPFMEVASKDGFSDEDLEEVKKICQNMVEQIKKVAYSQDVDMNDEPVPIDVMAVLNRHDLSIELMSDE